MRRLLPSVIFGFLLAVAAPVHALSEILAEEYILFTAASERIVLVDVESVEVTTTGKRKGLEDRKVVVVGKRVETIRGEDAGAEFSDQSEETIVADEKEAARFLSEDVIEMLSRRPPHLASQCKKGHRYLVIFRDKEWKIFFEVPKDNDEWRKQIRALHPNFAKEKKTEPAKPAAPAPK